MNIMPESADSQTTDMSQGNPDTENPMRGIRIEKITLNMGTGEPGPKLEKARKILETVGLGERLDHRPSQLSGGEQQRVAISRALANDPEIILGDEPTGNLDTKTSVKILELLKDLNHKGYTIVMVTHDPRIKEYADRVVELQDGKIIRETRK